MNNLSSNPGVIDLFCGIGGLSYAFKIEGFDVIAGIDNDMTCKYAYETNNKSQFIHQDISMSDPNSIHKLYGDRKVKILVGCAPCQPFSVLNLKNSTTEKISSDNKWKLLYSFSKLIESIQPEIVSMENVPQLRSFNNGSVFNDFIAMLIKNNYFITYGIYNAQDYGVPQRRKRLVLLASKFSKFEMITATHSNDFKTVMQTIGHLPVIEDGEHCESDYLHFSRKLKSITKERIIATPEGGSWQDWAEDLLLECHKKPGGKMYKSVYGRMSYNDVSPTITTYCTGLNNGRFGHPKQNRAISLREAALLQSFPEDYDLIDPNVPFNSQVLARQIGNAVPVGLGQAIAKSIKNHLLSLNGYTS
ncbi:putative BsuMI modification methylase subunit YdiO [bioreactor metagenome]|uniref:DNA (cytosine-5-)-methyltransferase n=1 Tax=bioreactor metagenome TaxID=1076179 RepID=A0A644UF39_9ZZZZ